MDWMSTRFYRSRIFHGFSFDGYTFGTERWVKEWNIIFVNRLGRNTYRSSSGNWNFSGFLRGKQQNTLERNAVCQYFTCVDWSCIPDGRCSLLTFEDLFSRSRKVKMKVACCDLPTSSSLSVDDWSTSQLTENSELLLAVILSATAKNRETLTAASDCMSGVSSSQAF